MSFKRIKLKAVDFELLAALCPPHQALQFNKFKMKTEDYINTVMGLPEEKPAIGWEDYEKKVKTPGMVAEFKKQYEQLEVPYPNDNVSQQIVAQEGQVLENIAQVKKDAAENIERVKKRLEVINSMPPVEEMTMEDMRDYYPEIALDPINRPTFWPHEPEDQPGYVDPNIKDQEAH